MKQHAGKSKRILKFGPCVAAVLFLGCSSAEKDWNAARQAHSVAGYESFLVDHPASQFANSARAGIDLLDFSSALSSNT